MGACKGFKRALYVRAVLELKGSEKALLSIHQVQRGIRGFFYSSKRKVIGMWSECCSSIYNQSGHLIARS